MKFSKNRLTIKIGTWVEVTATGPYAISVLATLVAVGVAGRFFGWW